MRMLSNRFSRVFVSFFGLSLASFAFATDNQTDQLSRIYPAAGLPFRITIEKTNFQLPVGIHSGVVGEFQGRWVFIAGRINGLHGFNPTGDFPPDFQSTRIYVVDPTTGVTKSRSIADKRSGLTQKQIDTLSVTSPQGFQDGTTLMMTGGYGIDSSTTTFSTKPVLTAFNLPGVIRWVTEPNNTANTLAKNIKQIYHPIFQITGGRMYKLGSLIQIVFGQTFEGEYTPGSNGTYSQQVRQFKLKNNGGKFTVEVYPSRPATPDPSFRRRDLNVIPVLLSQDNLLKQALMAFSGVFTVAGGMWTVPVMIPEVGNPVMSNPVLPTTFKQGMNNYACATAPLYSQKHKSMYSIFFGGISYGFYSGGTFQTDAELPFINQVTTVQIDDKSHFWQYKMDSEYPTILSTGSNPGNVLLFGAGAYFIPTNISHYDNRVINLDNIRQPTIIGYIVGGIQSTLANTNTMADSSASPHVFKVTLTPT